MPVDLVSAIPEAQATRVCIPCEPGTSQALPGESQCIPCEPGREGLRNQLFLSAFRQILWCEGLNPTGPRRPQAAKLKRWYFLAVKPRLEFAKTSRKASPPPNNKSTHSLLSSPSTRLGGSLAPQEGATECEPCRLGIVALGSSRAVHSSLGTSSGGTARLLKVSPARVGGFLGLARFAGRV